MGSGFNGTKQRCTFGRLGRESVLFTGPDGIRDYKAKVDSEHRYVGEGTMSPEGTSEADYLWRAPSSTPHPKPKSVKVGEIGWGVSELHQWFASSTTGAQLMLGEFKQAAEDRHTHLRQNPWYTGPKNKIGNEPGKEILLSEDESQNSNIPPPVPTNGDTGDKAVEKKEASVTSLKSKESSNSAEGSADS